MYGIDKPCVVKEVLHRPNVLFESRHEPVFIASITFPISLPAQILPLCWPTAAKRCSALMNIMLTGNKD